jgi:hypothetical protein
MKYCHIVTRNAERFKYAKQMGLQSLAQKLFCYRFKSAVVFLKIERKAAVTEFPEISRIR